LAVSTIGVNGVAQAQATPEVAPAPSAAASAPSQTGPDNAIFSLDQVVVTGTGGKQAKFKAPYSISTIDRKKIEEVSPHSTTDLLKSTPGLTVEASGGEGGSENVVIRGLPWSGWRLIDFQQDGMPLFESNTERFMNIDELFRVDSSIKRAEVVRGGTAPIFSNNAAGGVMNVITDHGSQTARGKVILETGTGSRKRIDANWSGPVTSDLTVSLSGFYRRDDGLRDPGFKNGDDGGQVRGAFAYSLERGQVFGDFTYLNDRALFYTAVPLTDPRNGNSLAGLIDPASGTMVSNAFRNVSIRTLDSSGAPVVVQRDLKDGIHPKIKTATLGGNYDLTDTLEISDTYRHTEGTLDFNAIFNGASPSDAASFLTSQLAGAKTAFGPSVNSLRYVYSGTQTPYSTATTAGLVMTNGWNSISTTLRYDANDLRLKKSLDTAFGKHDMTAGVYYSRYYFAQSQLLNSMLMNVKNNPDLLNIQALDASGAVVGSVTENGFTSYGSGAQNGSLHGESTALYVADTWHPMSSWSVDAGYRHVERKQTGVQGILGAAAADPNGAIPARTVRGVVSTQERSEKLTDKSWTVGSGYDISPKANVFGRYTNTFSFPRFDTVLGGATLPGSTETLPVSRVKQGEVGFKAATQDLQLFIVGFWSKFDKLNGGTQVADANGAITNSNIIFSTRTLGLEVEAVWTPFKNFEISATGMIQNPKMVSVMTLTGLDAKSSSEGTDIPRVPRTQFTLQPSYKFSIGEANARVFATIFNIGKRYQDFSNLSRLNGYTTLDLGASLGFADGFEVRANVNNVTNEIGLTEGNARAAVLGTGGVGDATVGRSIFGRNYKVSVSKTF
jgi:outer membrane receptor protein involved in Fe transport